MAAALALGANFVGTTSALLGVLPSETLDYLKLDVLYPIRGFKRFVDKEDGYEFLYPKVRTMTLHARASIKHPT